MKTCSRCKKSAPVCEFGPGHSKDGLSSWCRSCKASHERDKRRKRGIKEKPVPFFSDSKKECLICKETKDLENFPASKRGRLGRGSYCQECNAAWHILNSKRKGPEPARRATQKYRKNNKERWRSLHRVSSFNRRHLIKASDTGLVTDSVLLDLYSRVECAYCRLHTDFDKRTIDHVVPLIRGGLHDPSNLEMACFKCNSSKSSKLLEEWRDDYRENYLRLCQSRREKNHNISP